MTTIRSPGRHVGAEVIAANSRLLREFADDPTEAVPAIEHAETLARTLHDIEHLARLTVAPINLDRDLDVTLDDAAWCDVHQLVRARVEESTSRSLISLLRTVWAFDRDGALALCHAIDPGLWPTVARLVGLDAALDDPRVTIRETWHAVEAVRKETT